MDCGNHKKPEARDAGILPAGFAGKMPALQKRHCVETGLDRFRSGLYTD